MAGLALALAVALYLGGVFFVRSKTADIAVLQAEAAERLAINNHVARVQNKLSNLEAEKERLQSYFITPEEIPDFLALLEEFAESIGASAEVTDVGERDDDLVVRMTVSGDFQDLYNYGIFLEHIPYQVDVENYFMESAASGLASQSGEELLEDEWSSATTIVLKSYQPGEDLDE